MTALSLSSVLSAFMTAGNEDSLKKYLLFYLLFFTAGKITWLLISRDPTRRLWKRLNSLISETQETSKQRCDQKV